MTSLQGDQLQVAFQGNSEFKVADGTSMSPAGPDESTYGKAPTCLERPGVTPGLCKANTA
jgi:hypothetical protein